MSGQDLKVRVTPVGAPQRAADDWDLEFTHDDLGELLASGGVGLSKYLQDGTGSRWQVDDWTLYGTAY